MKIFLDANILFSASKSNGAIRNLIDLIEISGHSLLANTYVVIEAKKNLEIKFPQSLDYFNELLVRTQISSKVTPELKDSVIADDIYTDSWFSDHAPLSITYQA